MNTSTNLDNKPNPGNSIKYLNWADVEFPSDKLSVKRLRTIFPDKFDKGSALSNGFSSFFEPSDDEHSAHLFRLHDLINHERTVADYGFYNAIEPYPSETVDEYCRTETAEAKAALEELYVEFRLADSPETARLLIQQLEEEGVKQGKQVVSPTAASHRY